MSQKQGNAGGLYADENLAAAKAKIIFKLAISPLIPIRGFAHIGLTYFAAMPPI
jgi:hypothetical protein